MTDGPDKVVPSGKERVECLSPAFCLSSRFETLARNEGKQAWLLSSFRVVGSGPGRGAEGGLA